jgi:hypothetical protein
MPTKLPVLVAHLEFATPVTVAERVPAENERPAPMVVAATFPVESVRRSEFGSVETMRLEVLAVVAERYVEEAYVVYSWWRVEEALLITPPASWSKVEVEFQLVAGVNGQPKETPPPPVIQVPLIWKHFPVGRLMSPPSVEVAVLVAEMYPARKRLPCTERAMPGLVVPMPTLPPSVAK